VIQDNGRRLNGTARQVGPVSLPRESRVHGVRKHGRTHRTTDDQRDGTSIPEAPSTVHLPQEVSKVSASNGHRWGKHYNTFRDKTHAHMVVQVKSQEVLRAVLQKGRKKTRTRKKGSRELRGVQAGGPAVNQESTEKEGNKPHADRGPPLYQQEKR